MKRTKKTTGQLEGGQTDAVLAAASAPKLVGSEEIRIEYMPLDALLKAPRNPKLHNQVGITKAINRFGYVDPIVMDERSGHMSAGHGRLESLEKLHKAGKKPPGRLKVGPDGKWWVPVLRGISFKNDDEAMAYLLAANKLPESGGWDVEDVALIARQFDDNKISFDGIGFDPAELSAMLPSDDKAGQGAGAAAGVSQQPSNTPPATTPPAGPDPLDDYGDPPEKPITQPGDMWELGDHRLLCGDSTDDEQVDRLIGGRRVHMVLTDPPFAIYGSSTGIGADIADDKMVRPFFEKVLRTCFRVVPLFAHVYVNTDWRSWAAMWEAAKRSGLSAKNCIVWDKGSAGLGSNYANCYELVGYFVKLPAAKAMKSSAPTGQRQVHKPNIMRVGRVMGKEREHNAAKPVALLSEFIKNGSDTGQVVLDLFGGSGSTMLAAEKEGRTALLMEVEPKWADVIVKRWERHTGRKAKRVPVGDQRSDRGPSSGRVRTRTSR